MIRINLLPHREARRKQNKHAFYRLLGLAAIFGVVIMMAVVVFLGAKISEQDQRNAFIKTENGKLDDQIKEIATLNEDLAALKARQQAVEDLQSDRNQPVYLLDELFKQVPEGVFLRSFKQEGQRVSISGVAQSNERVSELLHNFTYSSTWLERPELIEIRAAMLGQGKETKKIFEFTMAVGVKRPGVKDKDNKDKTMAAAGNASASGAKIAMPVNSAVPASNVAMPANNLPASAGKAPAAGVQPADKTASDTDVRGTAVDAPKKP